MSVIDIWAVLADPDIPRDVGQRLLTRQAAARRGLPIPPCPEDDRPYLARHVIRQCADHGEVVRSGGGWVHLWDGRLCSPGEGS